MKINEFKKILKDAKNIVVMTGAGFSVASNIPDFRSENGLYNKTYKNLRPEEILSHHFFLEHTREFYDFYFNKMVYLDAMPNQGHLFLKELEKIKNVTIITQNIDGLHQKAGSKKVLELHGSTLKNKCMKCFQTYTIDEILEYKNIPTCKKCGGIIKPDVVLYEEMLDDVMLDDALFALNNADTLIIAGSSMTVSPASSLPFYFKGKNIVIVNLTKTPLDKYATLIINEKTEEVFSKINIEEVK